MFGKLRLKKRDQSENRKSESVTLHTGTWRIEDGSDDTIQWCLDNVSSILFRNY